MLKVNPTVCIVGNGGSLSKKSLGKIIDQHDVVVRCNFFEMAERSDCSKLKEVWIRSFEAQSTNFFTNAKKIRRIDNSVLLEPIKHASPTTGILGICYAISSFKYHPINIVGFGLSDKFDRTHYENRVLPFNGHDLEFERLLINKFVQQGFVRRLDECDNSLSRSFRAM